MIAIRHKEYSFSFFTRWPLSQWTLDSWPEVYYAAQDFVAERTSYHYHYEPFPPIRNEPPVDDPAGRVVLDPASQRSLLQWVFKDFATTKDTTMGKEGGRGKGVGGNEEGDEEGGWVRGGYRGCSD